MLIVKHGFQDKYTGESIKEGTIIEIEDESRKQDLIKRQLVGEAEVIILKKHEAITEESVNVAEPEAEKEAEVINASDFNEMTVKQIKELLDQKGIEYSFRAKKDELIELLGGD